MCIFPFVEKCKESHTADIIFKVYFKFCVKFF